jgi:uncharacterized protein YbjT (DUF2867 family)
VRIVITGGSGQVGQILARHFYSHGHQVAVVALIALGVGVWMLRGEQKVWS